MSDCNQCIPPDRQKPSFREVQDELQITLDSLRQLGEQLKRIGRRLPRPSYAFDPLAELRAAADCVRKDLLVDAVETLNFAATLTEGQLQERFEERLKWRVVVM
jgi:hypothetical protein